MKEKKKKKWYIAFAMLLVVTLTLTACRDQNLQTLSKALDDTAHGVAVLQKAVIDGNAQHLITDDAARAIMEFSIKVNLAGVDAVAVTRNINSLDALDRQKLLAIVTPIIQTLATGQALTATIADPAVRQQVVGALAIIQLSLNSAKLVLAASN